MVGFSSSWKLLATWTGSPISTSTPASSSASRAAASRTSSPHSTKPQGKHHRPAPNWPGPRWTKSTRPRSSRITHAAPMPGLAKKRKPHRPHDGRLRPPRTTRCRAPPHRGHVVQSSPSAGIARRVAEHSRNVHFSSGRSPGRQSSCTLDPGRMELLQLRGARVVLRPFRVDDVAAVLAYASDAEVTRHLEWDAYDDPATAAAFIRSTLGGPPLWYAYAVTDRETGALVGGADLRVVSAFDRRGEVGYGLARSHWGKGYAAEATALLVRF